MTHSPQRAAQIAEIERTLSAMFEPGDLVELRVLYGNGSGKRVDSGYFNDFRALAEEAARLDNAREPAPAGVYVTLNRIDPALLARAQNRIESKVQSGATTANADVTRRRWLLIDTDPERAAGISATDAELQAATKRAAQIEAWLAGQGWPAPLRALSGNGAHRLYRVDLPNTPEVTDLVKRCLAALAARFGDGAVKVDGTVFNAARIVKLYGTTARKGDSTEDRPHRRAALGSVADAAAVVPEDLVRELASMAPEDKKGKGRGKAKAQSAPKAPGEFWQAGTLEAVETWAAGHGIGISSKGGRKWSCECLTSNGAHSDGAALFLTVAGYLRYKCHHDSCNGATVADVLRIYPAPDAGQQRQQGAAPKGKDPDELLTSERIEDDLRAWGYKLWLNDLDDSVWNGDQRFDDIAEAVLRMQAYDAGYAEDGILSALDSAVKAFAAQNRRHPLREYLGALTWDGQDHIGKLAGYIGSNHDPLEYGDGTRRGVFEAFLRRWLVGSVAKMHGDQSAAMANFVLVLAGHQSLGKSHLARWLCPLDAYFVEQGIHPDSKDSSLRRMTAWVWEIAELGATTRRADVEALKSFVTAATVTERRPYGRFDLVKPAIASYVGTVNDDGAGFLSDATGNRRFVVVDLAHIDWNYSTAVDPVQVWAQAVALWRANRKAYVLTPEETAFRDRNNEEHSEHDPIADMIDSCFEKDSGGFVRSTRLLETLRTYAGMSRGNDRAQGKDVARALRKHWGIVGKRSNGATWYYGLKLRGWVEANKTAPGIDEMPDAGTAAAIIVKAAGV